MVPCSGQQGCNAYGLQCMCWNPQLLVCTVLLSSMSFCNGMPHISPRQAMLMMHGKVPVQQRITTDRGVGQRYGKHRESMGTCSATCGDVHDLWGAPTQRWGKQREDIPAAGSSSRRPLMAWVSSKSCWLPASPILRHLCTSSRHLLAALCVSIDVCFSHVNPPSPFIKLRMFHT